MILQYPCNEVDGLSVLAFHSTELHPISLAYNILMISSALRRELLTSIGLPVLRPTLPPVISFLRGSNLVPLSVAPFSVAPFSASKMTMSVTEAVTHDHRELGNYYNNIINAPGTDTAIRWQDQFVWELARHSIGEVFIPPPY